MEFLTFEHNKENTLLRQKVLAMPSTAPPRIYCIPAINAPIAAVFRRGPTTWSHIGRWDLKNMRYDPGAWFKGRIFPRRSDLSPDGRFLCYFAHKPSAIWEKGEAYVAVSKLPWLTALHAFPTCGTWTRGYHFTEKKDRANPDDAQLPIPYGLWPIPSVQFAAERRRDWTEAPDSPQRDPHAAWDDRRNARLQKSLPGGHRLLCVESAGWAGGEFGVDQAVDGLRVHYSLEADGDIHLLDNLQWADWDGEGRLLAATRSGKLQIRDLDAGDRQVVFEEDLTRYSPDPNPAPEPASRW